MGSGLVEEDAVEVFYDDFGGSAGAESYSGAAGGVDFERGHAEVFFAGKDEGAGAAGVVGNDLVGGPAEENDVGVAGGEGFEAGAVGAVADDDEAAVEGDAGLDGKVKALVGDEAREGEVEGVGIRGSDSWPGSGAKRG